MLKLDTKVKISELEQQQAQERELNEFRARRQAAIENAVVTTKKGNKYDADEQSISRMANRLLSITAEPATYSVLWSMADTPTGVMTSTTKADLAEAHRLAVEYVTANWSR